MSSVSTPCIQVCVLDPLSNLCIGCGRTPAEIAAWGEMTELERAALMGELGERLRTARSRARRGGRVSGASVR